MALMATCHILHLSCLTDISMRVVLLHVLPLLLLLPLKFLSFFSLLELELLVFLLLTLILGLLLSPLQLLLVVVL